MSIGLLELWTHLLASRAVKDIFDHSRQAVYMSETVGVSVQNISLRARMIEYSFREEDGEQHIYGGERSAK